MEQRDHNFFMEQPTGTGHRWQRVLAGTSVAVLAGLVVITGLIHAPQTHAAELTPAGVKRILADEAAGTDKLSRKDLSGLDLSGIDFKGADLFATNFTGATLARADLSGTNLDRAVLSNTDLSSTDFSRSSMFATIVLGARFSANNFKKARIVAVFDGMDLPGADFSDAILGADMKNQPMGLMRTSMKNANLRFAKFRNADLSRVAFDFADLSDSDLSGASLMRAELVGANLSRATVKNADVTLADVDSATLIGLKDKPSIRGWKTLRNLDLATTD